MSSKRDSSVEPAPSPGAELTFSANDALDMHLHFGTRGSTVDVPDKLGWDWRRRRAIDLDQRATMDGRSDHADGAVTPAREIQSDTMNVRRADASDAQYSSKY